MGSVEVGYEELGKYKTVVWITHTFTTVNSQL